MENLNFAKISRPCCRKKKEMWKQFWLLLSGSFPSAAAETEDSSFNDVSKLFSFKPGVPATSVHHNPTSKRPGKRGRLSEEEYIQYTHEDFCPNCTFSSILNIQSETKEIFVEWNTYNATLSDPFAPFGESAHTRKWGLPVVSRAFLQKGWDTLPLLTREDEHRVRQNDPHQIPSCAFWVFHNTSHVW